MKEKWENVGYTVAVSGTALILLWIGAFKFTETEAKAIQPLVENHYFMNLLYSVFNIRQAAIFIGITEIITAVCLILSFWSPKAGALGGLLTVVTFMVTLSFLITTPGTWSFVEGFPVTDFFIVKDLPALGVGLMVWGKNRDKAFPF